MTQKYIAIGLDAKEGSEAIVVFPPNFDHNRFAETLDYVRFQQGDAQDILGAGFVANGACYGTSESLGIRSRGNKDTALLRQPTTTLTFEHNGMRFEVHYSSVIDYELLMDGLPYVKTGPHHDWRRDHIGMKPVQVDVKDRFEGKTLVRDGTPVTEAG